MNPDRLPDDDALEIFLDTLEHQESKRADYARSRCGDDADLLATVHAYLQHHERSSWLDGSADDVMDSFLDGPIESIGEYEIVRKLGSGSMGTVYLGFDEQVDRHVAIKVLRGAGVSASDERRLLAEARAAGKLDHPGIVPVHGAGRDGDAVYIVMGYVEGDTLRDRLASAWDAHTRSGGNGLVPQQVRSPAWILGSIERVTKLARALDYAHRNGVIHRDVKPANILLDENDEPKLVDFGIASLPSEPLETLIHGAGTLAYLSPERAKGDEKNPDRRSDVFALGAVLYECLTSLVPYEADTLAELLKLLQSDASPARIRTHNLAVPKMVEAVCFKALDPDPRLRYQTTADFAEDLERALAGEPIRGLQRFARHRRWLRRKRTVIAMTGLALVAGGIGAAVALYDPPPTGALHITGPSNAVLSLRRVDPVYRTPGEILHSAVGALERKLPEGVYRISASLGTQQAEYTRRVVSGQAVEASVLSPGGDWTTEGMIFVPAGTAVVGREGDSGPGFERREVDLPAFWIDSTEVSNRAYREYVEATGAPPPPHWPVPYDESFDARPVVGVSMLEARRYAEWAGKRLPTDIEWERAAAGAEGRAYPWGEAPPPPATVSSPEGSFFGLDPASAEARGEYLAGVLPVEASDYDRTPEGGLHFFGNVAEWTESWIKLEGVPGSPELVIAKGTNWNRAGATGAPSLNSALNPESKKIYVGFRCVRPVAMN